ncbi:hypothetical protein FK220_000460 [Flavobacteriaceae bacterium TP-CH-4]|uniref:Uncharacterized protein n=1 Tax=Pelagihabitans pacificus TaxID=2696054 RepID=A0A967AWA2_9FLAO|nr:hypothetical protein [Pelagihabitans pacificus]NHF57791.1 hypothetical protein [Pelagihabitans pacificus]
MLKSIVYFEVGRLGLPAVDAALINRIDKEFPMIRMNEPPFDMAFMDASNLGNLPFDADMVHNDTVIVVDNIHGTNKNRAAWKKIKTNPIVTVTIDLYYCGVVFLRKEQARQHFKIRI